MSVAQSASPAFATQRALEGLALKLAQAPDVAAARAQARALFLEDPDARTPDGAASVEDAADQHFWGAVLLALNTDPYHPKIVPLFLYRHDLDGQSYPSALHGGLENPDNVYRAIPLSPDSRYVIHGVRHSPAPAQITYELMDSIPGLRSIGRHLAMLKDRDMVLGPDGAFTITLDSDPANGRANHIQLTPEARCLFIRDTLSDWSSQSADSLTIERVGGPDRPPATEAQLTHEAAQLVVDYARFWHELPKIYRTKLAVKTNAFNPPAPRDGAWGFIANTHFEIADDEAFVFTTHPSDAPYHAVLIGNHWWIALDADLRSGAFNTAQARANPDGSFTFVIAARDPGVWNWLDTAGLHSGIIQVRWQGTPPDLRALPDGITAGKLVKLSDLESAVPKTTVWVTPQQRQVQLAERHASYLRRLTAP